MFVRKTKVSCYKSEINQSVMLHAFLKKNKGIVSQCLTKTQKTLVSCNKQKYCVTVVKKASNKIRANGISHFMTF